MCGYVDCCPILAYVSPKSDREAHKAETEQENSLFKIVPLTAVSWFRWLK